MIAKKRKEPKGNHNDIIILLSTLLRGRKSTDDEPLPAKKSQRKKSGDPGYDPYDFESDDEGEQDGDEKKDDSEKMETEQDKPKSIDIVPER